LELVLGIYLRVGVCDLGFETTNPALFRLCSVSGSLWHALELPDLLLGLEKRLVEPQDDLEGFQCFWNHATGFISKPEAELEAGQLSFG